MMNAAIAVFCSAGLWYSAFPNFLTTRGFETCAWFFSVPLLLVMARQGFWGRMLMSGCWGLMAYGLLVQWLIPVSAAGWALFVLVLSVQPLIFGLLYHAGRERGYFLSKTAGLFYIPSAWVVSEYLRNNLMGGFTWSLGYSQAMQPALIQQASWGGVYAVSWSVMFVNVALLCWVGVWQQHGPGVYSRRWLWWAIGILALVVVSGEVALRPLPPDSGLRSWRVHALQPNISRAAKADAARYDDNAQAHLTLLEQRLAQSPADLVVWPETSFPDDILQDSVWRPRLEETARRTRMSFIVGSALLWHGRDVNAAMLLTSDGRWKDMYFKQRLVPFTEYMPEKGWGARVAAALGLSGRHFLAGQAPGIFFVTRTDASGIPSRGIAGVAICSEEAYPDLFRDMARRGAGFAVVMLNDSWFQAPEALMLHARFGILRAVENGLPLVRAANTGWTAAFDGNGRLAEADAPDVGHVGAAHFLVTERALKTVYTKFGDIFAWMCAGFVIINFMIPLLPRSWLVWCLTGAVVVSSASPVHAAAAVQRRVQMQKQMQQQAIQQQYEQQYQQAVAQKQAQEMAMYQQAMAQKQAYEQAAYQQAAYQKAAAEYAAYKQAMQQAVAKRQAELQAVQQVKQAIAEKQAVQMAQVEYAKQAVAYKNTAEMVKYQQAVQARQVMEAKTQAEINQQVREYADYMAKRKVLLEQQAAVAKEVVTAKAMMQHNAVQQAAAVKTRVDLERAAEQQRMAKVGATAVVAGAAPPSQRFAEPSGQETEVGLHELWAALDETSYPWTQIMDDEIKLLTVAEYIDRFSRANIRIRKAPGGYVRLIDALIDQSPELLDGAFMNVLSYAAIVEYDFENGQNKDELARRVLGEERYKANKLRMEGR